MRLLSDYGLDEHAAEMKEWYDGYRFGYADVYCPWDVINYANKLLARARTPGRRRFGSTPAATTW